MLIRKVTILIIGVFFIVRIECSKFRILAFLPYLGRSHFNFAGPLFEELARRGNNVTVVSHHPKTEPFPNYNDISIAKARQVGNVNIDAAGARNNLINTIAYFQRGVDEICHQALSHPNLQRLIMSKGEQFDVLIIEAFNSDCFFGFQHKFKAPVIAFRTSALSPWVVDRSGNPDNPSYIPGIHTGLASRMNFFQRAQNLFYSVVSKLAARYFTIVSNGVARKHFGEDMPDLDEIVRNTSLYLVNSHFVHQYAKPLLPNVREVGGLHVKEPKSLPEDLENWFSGAKHGVVYLNFGSIGDPSTLSADKKNAIFKVFSKLPQRILMKWNGEVRPNLPTNVKLIKWAPQNDILHHPNIRLFISHGGMLGINEAMHAGVPMLLIPFSGDGLTNAALLQERGCGLVLHYSDLEFDPFEKAVLRLLNEPRFTKKAQELSIAFKDRPLPPMEEAVYWIEYVGRHKGAPLLRTIALDLPLYQYLLLDVIGAFLILIFIILYALKFIWIFFKSLFQHRQTKLKAS